MKVRIGFGLGVRRAARRRRASATSSTGSRRTASTRSGSRSGVGGDAPDPVIGLAFAAGRTRSLKLGTSVQVLPGRNPALARQGVGEPRPAVRRPRAARVRAGEPAGRRASGVRRRRARSGHRSSTRRSRSSGGSGARTTSTTTGRTSRTAGSRSAPSRCSTPLDVWLGGRAKCELRRCGRLGDGWLASFLTAAECAERRPVIEKAAAEAGRARSTTSTTARWCSTRRGRPRRGQRAPGRAPAGERPGRPRRNRVGPSARPTRRLHRRRVLEAGRGTARRAHLGRRHDGELGSRAGDARRGGARPSDLSGRGRVLVLARHERRARQAHRGDRHHQHGHDRGRDRDGAGRAERLTEERHADQRSDAPGRSRPSRAARQRDALPGTRSG